MQAHATTARAAEGSGKGQGQGLLQGVPPRAPASRRGAAFSSSASLRRRPCALGRRDRLGALLRSVVALLLFAGAAAASAQGAIVAIGGAMQDGTVSIWQRIVELAGGPGSRFVVMSPGSSDPEASSRSIVAQLQRHGAVAEVVRDASQLALVAEARGLFFGGGDQSRIVDQLAPGGRPTPLLEAIRALHARGGVLAGSSAGAAVMSEVMFTGGEPLAVLKGTAGAVHRAGLGFVRPGVLVDQHFIKRGRVGRLVPTLQRLNIPLGLGVEEDSAAVIRGDSVEVVGSRGVLVVDLREARHDAAAAAFNLRGAKLSWLEAGDRMDLDSGRVTASPLKRATRLVGPANPAWRPYHRGDHLFTELLADRMITNAMERLVDSRADDIREVRGLVFDPLAVAGSAEADLGFLWRLTRGPDTSAWSAGDRYTMAHVLLEVQPVRMGRPLFTPLNRP